MTEIYKYRIVNKDNKSIGKHDLYDKLANAKNAAHNCKRYLDKNSRIVKVKVIEEIVEEIPINVTPHKVYFGQEYYNLDSFGVVDKPKDSLIIG